MAPTITLTDDAVAEAKSLYEAGAPIAEICQRLDISPHRFRVFRNETGWPLRPPFGPSGARKRQTRTSAKSEAKSAKAKRAKPKPAKPEPEKLVARLEEAIEREFRRAEQALEKKPPDNVEASARTLASLVKSLAELRRMRRDAGAKDDNDRSDPPPRELAELRAELARRIERLTGAGTTE